MDGKEKNFRMVSTGSNHFGILIENEGQEVKEIMYAEGREEELDTFKGIKKVHEVTNHKSADQLEKIYRNAGLVRPDTVKTIRGVVKDCKVCQKFGRSIISYSGEVGNTVYTMGYR